MPGEGVAGAALAGRPAGEDGAHLSGALAGFNGASHRTEREPAGSATDLCARDVPHLPVARLLEPAGADGADWPRAGLVAGGDRQGARRQRDRCCRTGGRGAQAQGHRHRAHDRGARQRPRHRRRRDRRHPRLQRARQLPRGLCRPLARRAGQRTQDHLGHAVRPRWQGRPGRDPQPRHPAFDQDRHRSDRPAADDRDHPQAQFGKNWNRGASALA